MFQFIHAADIHLDSPLRGLMQFEGAPVERIQSATRDAFRNLVQLAIEERVAFVLIAGDLWDCDWPDAGPALFFIREAARLAKAGIPIYIVKGNHDAQSRLTGSIRRWPANVRFLSHNKPETVRVPGLDVAIHGQSYPTQHVGHDLTIAYPAPISNAFNIGLLHTSLEDGEATYAPTSGARLVMVGYDYWALGHVHQRQNLSSGGVHIEFPGNLQGRSIREAGPKGCSLVTVADDHTVTSRFEPLDTVRWLELTVEVGELDASEPGVERAVRLAFESAIAEHSGSEEGRLLAVRLHLTLPAGVTIPTGQSLRDQLNAIAVDVGDIWIERILTLHASCGEVLTAPIQTLPIALEVQSLVASLSAESAVSQWMEDFAELRARFTGELSETEIAKALNDKTAFRALVAQVGEEL